MNNWQCSAVWQYLARQLTQYLARQLTRQLHRAEVTVQCDNTSLASRPVSSTELRGHSAVWQYLARQSTRQLHRAVRSQCSVTIPRSPVDPSAPPSCAVTVQCDNTSLASRPVSSTELRGHSAVRQYLARQSTRQLHRAAWSQCSATIPRSPVNPSAPPSCGHSAANKITSTTLQKND